VLVLDLSKYYKVFKMLKIVLIAVLAVYAVHGSFVVPEDCMAKCPAESAIGESYVQCERGCRFFGYALAHGSSARDKTFVRCQEDCEAAYGLTSASLGQQTKSCLMGCNLYNDMIDAAAPASLKEGEDEGMFGGLQPLMTLREVAMKTVDGIRMMQTRVVAFFLDGDKLIQVETQPQVFIDIPAGEGEVQSQEETEGRMDEGLVWGKPLQESVERVEKVRVMRTDAQHMLALITTTMIILLVALYVLVLYRRSLLKKNKKANLAVAVNHEPLKLVLPEDLTKLSLVEEDDGSATKQGLSLPDAKV